MVLDPFEALPGEELDSALRRALAYLKDAGIEYPLSDVELLASHVLSTPDEEVSRGRVQTLALLGTAVPPSFYELVTERGRRVPLQHLTGKAAFRFIELAVGPGVFVPRPETELLVEHALDALKDQQKPQVVDLCTGSGAIAASFASERPDASVYAVELSPLAHAWAEKNVAPYGVQLLLDDATTALTEKSGEFDAVLSNPPYIPTGAVPQDPEVRDHDPEMALYGGSEDGMKIPRAVTKHAFELLKPGGYFIAEHAETQRESMREALAQAGFENIESINDLTGRPRHTAGYKPADRD